MTDPQPLATPQVAGYRREELIGRGGNGEVYRAHDVRLGRPVARKVLAAEVVADEQSRERLLRESRLAASLDHPNVIPGAPSLSPSAGPAACKRGHTAAP